MRWAITIASLVGLASLTGVSVVLVRLPLAKASAPAPASCQDLDGDGYGLGCSAGPDCNDHDARIHPSQAEICNLRDDNCNGLVDDMPNCTPPALNPAPVMVAASELLMGSPPNQGASDEHPLHRVRVSGFSMDRYEVTNERYGRCVKAGVCQAPALLSSAKRQNYFGQPEFAQYPVVFVDWERADKFCRWEGGRLPTEAEWELAARGPAPSQRAFPWGDAPPDCTKANLGGELSCLGDTDRVGRRTAGVSPWGAMDLAGNVWEWTADWYDSQYYKASPERDPKGPNQGTLKVMRGGCFMSNADSLRVSCRKPELPATWAPNVGFRCVR